MNPHVFTSAPTMHPALSVGIDIAQISAVGASLTTFGERFLGRIFSAAEAAYATQSPALAPQRLAARFAAKEAAMKAFGWSEAGVAWREIEVTRTDDGACALALHGSAARMAAAGGWTEICVSLSHDGDYATAVVAALSPKRVRSHPDNSPNP
jgi:holo-[acyl-carrier protein] synthase